MTEIPVEDTADLLDEIHKLRREVKAKDRRLIEEVQKRQMMQMNHLVALDDRDWTRTQWVRAPSNVPGNVEPMSDGEAAIIRNHQETQ